MKPPAFQYHDPRTLDEALSRLAEFGDRAKVLAGGQSLVPLLNFRLARPEVVIDINGLAGGLAGLGRLAPSGDGLRIGALTRHRAVETSALVRERCPVLAEAVPQIGHRQIRNRGTFGGSLAHADPAAELPLIVTLLDAEIWTRRGDQTNRYWPADFFQGYLTTALEPDELLTEVHLPAWPAGAGWAFEELSPRAGDFALVAAAAVCERDRAGAIRRLRLALGGVGPVPARLIGVEDLAIGRPVDDRLLVDIDEVTRSAIEPDSDIHASAEYRREVAGVLARRVVARAAGRASGSHD